MTCGDRADRPSRPGPDETPGGRARAAGSARLATALAVAGALLATLVVAWVCRQHTDGTLIYALDDPYIHLAMARTLAEHGMLGVNEQTPCAASSSPAWTLLLTVLTMLFGVSHWYPLALNLIAVAALVFLCDLVLREHFGMSAPLRLAMVAAVMLIGPVAPLAMTGMEHVAHAAAVLLLTHLALSPARRRAPALGGVAALATGLRYESAFVVAALALVLALQGRRGLAAAMVGGSLAVVLIVGALQVQAGEYFLPSSLLVKALPSDSLVGVVKWRLRAAVDSATEGPLAVFVIGAAIAGLPLLGRRPGDHEAEALRRRAVQWAPVLGGAALLHWALAQVGWFSRYEAYLIIMGVVVMAGLLNMQLSGLSRSDRARILRPAGNGAWSLAVVISLAALILATSSRMEQYRIVPRACRNIHEQQHQMARFVREHYHDSAIVISDIGMVSLMSNARILDLWGLATREVTDAIRERRRTGEFVARLADDHGATVAMLYHAPHIPDKWTLVATWRIRNNVVCGGDEVGFYAVAADQAPELVRQLREFEAKLPTGVEVTYLWAGDRPGGTTWRLTEGCS